MERVKVVILLTVLTIMLVTMGYIFGGQNGIILAFGFALFMNFGSYWFSDKVALAMSGAREVSEAQDPELHRIVAQVAAMAKIAKPRVYIIPSEAANAFATGRNQEHSAVAVTMGIRKILSERELIGVLSHEIGHVKDRHILAGAIVATIAGAITALSHFGQFSLMFGNGRRRDNDPTGGILGLVILLLAPIGALIVQLAISRQNEYEADMTGAKITGDPLALASALGKLEQRTQAMPMNVNPSMAPLYIVHPFNGQGVTKLFSTHPPIAQRIARLEALDRQLHDLKNPVYNSLVR